MKKLLLVCMLFMFSYGMVAAVNALKPTGTPEKIDPKKLSAVVIPGTATAKEKFAANLLVRSLEKMAAQKLRIFTDVSKVTGKAIIINPPSSELGDEGYTIEVRDGNIYLTGGLRRSAINAAIALLEEDLGCRWYVKGQDALLPEISGEMTVVPRKFIPRLINREPLYNDAFDLNFEVMNRINQSWKANVSEELGGTWNFPRNGFVHTLDVLLPSSLFKSHPEYFALINGTRQVNKTRHKAAQPCLSNPDVVKIVAANAIAMIEKNPNAEIISISTNDGSRGFCQCDKCRAMYDKEGVSGALINFVNNVTLLINQKYPDMKTETLAYLETFDIPKTIKPEKNVYIRLCTDTHAWRYPLFTVDESKTFYTALKNWNRIGAKLLIWDYNVDFGNFLHLVPNLWVTDKNLDILLKNNVKGVMYQGSFMSPGGASAPMYVWIMSKRLWNPEWKLDDLINDFCEGYYGAAAPMMKEYVALQKQEWQSFHDRYKGEDIEKIQPKFEFSDHFIPAFRTIMERALDAVKNDPVMTERIRREELNYIYMRLENGPKDKADIAAYRNDLKKFEALLKQFNVSRLSENGNDQIANKLLALECNIADTLSRPISEKSIRICPHTVHLWPVPAELRAKFETVDGKPVLTQAGGKSAWSMQWHFPQASQLVDMNTYRGLTPGKKYKIRMLAKADIEPGAGNGLMSCAYYSIGEKKILGTVILNESNLLGEEFVEITGPEFTFNPNGYFYVTPINNPKCKKIYFDYMEIIPVN